MFFKYLDLDYTLCVKKLYLILNLQQMYKFIVFIKKGIFLRKLRTPSLLHRRWLHPRLSFPNFQVEHVCKPGNSFSFICIHPFPPASNSKSFTFILIVSKYSTRLGNFAVLPL